MGYSKKQRTDPEVGEKNDITVLGRSFLIQSSSWSKVIPLVDAYHYTSFSFLKADTAL